MATPTLAHTQTPRRDRKWRLALDSGWRRSTSPNNALEFYIQELRDRGWDEQADRTFGVLEAIANKRLASKHTNVPTADVVAHWPEISATLIEMAELYLGTRP